MKAIIRTCGLAVSTATAIAVLGFAAGGAGASGARTTVGVTTSGAVTKTFSFIGRPNSATTTVVSIDSFVINARCNPQGEPVVYAFSFAKAADLFGRVFDGLGRLHIIRDSSFSKPGSFRLSVNRGDYDATGNVMFEASNGDVVTVDLAFDNSTTLNRQNLCTVYGSIAAS